MNPTDNQLLFSTIYCTRRTDSVKKKLICDCAIEYHNLEKYVNTTYVK